MDVAAELHFASSIAEVANSIDAAMVILLLSLSVESMIRRNVIVATMAIPKLFTRQAVIENKAMRL